MNKGFYTILLAQFLSALADNALLFAAIALLQEMSSPTWHTPLLKWFFVLSYIVLAPFVGSLADSFPKGRVMFVSNAIKFIGSISMILGMPPLFSYAIVGVGAAAYSPAKYGILTEFLPHHMLVKANGWMEGSTVAAIILGAYLGGIMASVNPHLAIIVITGLYMAAAGFNMYIPVLPFDHAIKNKNPIFMLQDFWVSFKTLWRDGRGQISLAVTTLFWGAGATLQFVVLDWSKITFNYQLDQANLLIMVVAVGIAVGSIFAARYIKLENSLKVLPAGILMGFLVMSMILVHDSRTASFLLFIIGALSGFFVVPLNALLQHRGHVLIGAGHSIAVQNFNENLGILLLIGLYTLMIKAELHIYLIIVAFGLFVSVTMSGIYKLYRKQIHAG
jgi:MFS transporter, LPLT family, lysophospholipid transporter